MAKGQGLTDRDIAKGVLDAKASGRTVILRDTGRTPGLQLVITANGTATWSLLYTPKGELKPKRLKLGRNENKFGLVQARLAAGVLRAKIAEHADPAIERAKAAEEEKARLAALKAEAAKRREEERARKVIEARRVTVIKLSELYFADRAGHSGMAKAKRTIDFSVIPVIGTMHTEDLARTDLQRVVDAVKARILAGLDDEERAEASVTQTYRVIEALRPMLKWGIDRGHLKREQEGIWLKLKMPKKGEARDRVLSASEIKWLWERLKEWKATEPRLSCILRIALLTGQRIGECCTIEKKDLHPNGRLWIIPGGKTKNSKPHQVPLGSLARQVMAEALELAHEDGRIFVGPRGATVRPDDIRIIDMIREWRERNPDAEEIEHFTVHDLRRTMTSRLEEQRIPEWVRSRLLNHISAKKGSVTTKHYSHGDILKFVLEALAKWQGLVERCIEGDDPFKVEIEDLDAIEARALAEVRGGKPKLQIVS